MVGSAIVRELQRQGYTNIITRTHKELDLTRQDQVEKFFAEERPEYVFLAAAKVGGIVANQEALASFQRNLDERVGAWVGERNAAPATHSPVRTLVIEPRIEKIRFISGGARFWAGAFAGSSRILVKMKLTDQDTGQVIAEPEFYQHAKGMAGAWTFGAADNSMLVRSASLALDYLKDNHAAAQGGRTGWEKE